MKRIIPETYKEYSAFVENENLEYDNTLTNTYGSIDVSNKKINKKYLYTALLFSYDKVKSDAVMSMVQKLKIDDDMMDSRCHSSGLWKSNNVLVLGMAPGRKGRAFQKHWLKPSFIYTKTSFILRKAIENNLKTIPYITNLCKFATRTNQLTKSEYDKCKHILEYELDEMKPRIIIALGIDVFNYLNDIIKPVAKVIKVMHPAGSIYQGMTVEDYSQHFKEKIKHV